MQDTIIRKFHEAKIQDKPAVEIWGTGKPRREFLYVDDLADACVFLMENYTCKDIGIFVNIGTGEDLTSMELAELIKRSNYSGCQVQGSRLGAT